MCLQYKSCATTLLTPTTDHQYKAPTHCRLAPIYRIDVAGSLPSEAFEHRGMAESKSFCRRLKEDNFYVAS
jgi:hypothetical protein